MAYGFSVVVIQRNSSSARRICKSARIIEAVASDAHKIERALTELSHRCYARGWAFGTSGNFSAVLSQRPFRLAITASGRDKRALRPADIVTVDARGEMVARRPGRPSAETLLHVTIARARQAGAVVHTHSTWSTILSERYAPAGGFGIDGYEMLKGLHGVTSHDHREWIPILENDQQMPRLARAVGELLEHQKSAHALLLRRHGLYTWGDTLSDAERHVEILEFLFETMGRTPPAGGSAPEGGTPWRS
jgi:methylthioribulose-1-phosphate dehydratase